MRLPIKMTQENFDLLKKSTEETKATLESVGSMTDAPKPKEYTRVSPRFHR